MQSLRSLTKEIPSEAKAEETTSNPAMTSAGGVLQAHAARPNLQTPQMNAAIQQSAVPAAENVHVPKEEKEPIDPSYKRIALDTSTLKTKALFGLFIKLRSLSTIRQAQPLRRGAPTQGAVPIFEPLDKELADMTRCNSVLFIEWQTNRAKKENCVKALKLEKVALVSGVQDPSAHCYLGEKAPERIVPEKSPIYLMQYETTFASSKKRVLKVAHVNLDNRRKYFIACPPGYWPVYELWEMAGPHPENDKRELVYRSPEVPPALPFQEEKHAETSPQSLKLKPAVLPPKKKTEAVLSFALPDFSDMESVEAKSTINDLVFASPQIFSPVELSTMINFADYFTKGLVAKAAPQPLVKPAILAPGASVHAALPFALPDFNDRESAEAKCPEVSETAVNDLVFVSPNIFTPAELRTMLNFAEYFANESVAKAAQQPPVRPAIPSPGLTLFAPRARSSMFISTNQTSSSGGGVLVDHARQVNNQQPVVIEIAAAIAQPPPPSDDGFRRAR